MSKPINLIVFDADDTLWQGLDGGFIAGVNYQDEGRDDYTFHRLDELHIQRNDGQRFRLFPEVPGLFPELVRRGVLISLASYNRAGTLQRAMQTFEMTHFFQHPAVAWSSRKDCMLQSILKKFDQDGYHVTPQSTLFIDDDIHGKYRPQMAEMGINFLQRGVDIQDLSEILDHPEYFLIPVQKK